MSEGTGLMTGKVDELETVVEVTGLGTRQFTKPETSEITGRD